MSAQGLLIKIMEAAESLCESYQDGEVGGWEFVLTQNLITKYRDLIKRAELKAAAKSPTREHGS